MNNGDIVRYVQITFGFGEAVWYIDEDDCIEERDKVLVSYGTQEKEGIVISVVRCIYPYVIYPIEKTKAVLEIIERHGKAKF